MDEKANLVDRIVGALREPLKAPPAPPSGRQESDGSRFSSTTLSDTVHMSTPAPPSDRRRKKRPSGLTLKQLQLLQIIHHHGWLSVDLLRQTAEYYEIPASGGSITDALHSLLNKRYLWAVKVPDGTRRLAYSVTRAGQSRLHLAGEQLKYKVRLSSDFLTLQSHLAIARIVNELRTAIEVSRWSTRLEIRADNSQPNGAVLAADYDAVVSFPVSGRPVRVGFVFDGPQTAAAQSEALCSRLQSENHLHAILYLVSHPKRPAVIAAPFSRAAVCIAFIGHHDFLFSKLKATASTWIRGQLVTAPIGDILAGQVRLSVANHAPTTTLRSFEFIK